MTSRLQHVARHPIPSNAVIGLFGTVCMIVIGASERDGRLFSFASAALLAVLTARVLVGGVRMEQDSILIRGVLRSRRIPLADLKGFSFGPLGLFPSVGIAKLRDGRQFAISSIYTSRVASSKARSKAESQIAELNRQLAERRLSGARKA
jgi:hypothetical protein